MQRQPQKQKRGVDRFAAENDEWDDLPLVRASQTAGAPPPDNHNHRPTIERLQQQRQQQSPQLHPRPQQHPPNHPQQRKRSRSSGDPPLADTAAPRSSNPSQLSRAVTTPPQQQAFTADAADAAASAAANQKPKKEREPVHCRGFKAGFCSSGVQCRNIHDGRQAEQQRTAWLAGGALPGPPPDSWGLLRETAKRCQGPYGGLPGVAAGVPPVLVIAGNLIERTLLSSPPPAI